MQECPFCQIAQKKLDTALVYEDEHVVGFHDINPKAPIHILIIPKIHIATLNDLQNADTGLVGHMVWTASQIAQTMQIADLGYRLVFNCNNAGGQTVFHIHLHLLGGRALTWPPG